MPFWLLMIFAPKWSFTKKIIGSLWIVVPIALLYAVLIIPQASALLPQLANPTLNTIASGLGTPEGATVGWIHFLAFDLFVGRWAYLDSRAKSLNIWMTGIALFFILMMGPFGLLLYLALRARG